MRRAGREHDAGARTSRWHARWHPPDRQRYTAMQRVLIMPRYTNHSVQISVHSPTSANPTALDAPLRHGAHALRCIACSAASHASAVAARDTHTYTPPFAVQNLAMARPTAMVDAMVAGNQGDGKVSCAAPKRRLNLSRSAVMGPRRVDG